MRRRLATERTMNQSHTLKCHADLVVPLLGANDIRLAKPNRHSVCAKKFGHANCHRAILIANATEIPQQGAFRLLPGDVLHSLKHPPESLLYASDSGKENRRDSSFSRTHGTSR